jgi:hypothetical protein
MNDVLGPLVGLIIVVFLIWGAWHFSMRLGAELERPARERRKRREDSRQRERERALKQAMVDLALTCPACGKLAPPIPGTANRYRCPDCGHQFAADPHNL